MPLWGDKTAAEKKPTWLSTEDAKNTYMTEKGWTFKNAKGLEEVLVAIGGGAERVGAPNIFSVWLDDREYSNSNVVINVEFNEKVVVTGTPYILLGNTSGVWVGDHKANYVSGANTNQLVFTYPVVSGDTINAETGANLSLAASITLNSGTIVDYSNASVNANVSMLYAGADNDTDVRPDITGISVIVA